MNLGDDDCYIALKARDARFDGQFFTCVTSTGIYCRPICPARTPKRSNCRFVGSAAAAQDAGFRPCLRCRPESAPGSPEWLGSESVVHRALRIIDESSGDDLSIDAISSELGISSRQLRRLFTQSLGTGPKSVIQANRISLARQLLRNTKMPIAEVALASGFGSIRRFNTVVRKLFGVSPTALRNNKGSVTEPGIVRLNLGYRPPFNWPQILTHFESRAIASMEAVNGHYIRTVRIGSARGRLRIVDNPDHNSICAELALDKTTDLSSAVPKVRDLLDLDAAPRAIAKHLGADPDLHDIVNAHPGLRCPGTWDIFEMLVRAIVGQQVSVAGARTVLARIVAALGEQLPNVTAETDLPDRLFPTPEALAAETLQPYGLNTARAETINRVAAEFAANRQFLHTGLPIDVARKRLLAIRGIGPWTADYVLLRGLRYPDAFPAADLGALKAAGVAKPRELAEIAERWRPWRGYALLYLWKSLETNA